MMKMRKLLFSVILLASLMAGHGLASQPAAELPLNQTQDALAYEVNPDSQGILWISDYGAGEIRGVNPTDGSYNTYPVGGGPSDARSDGAGNLWWADASSNQVGRLDIDDGSVSIWEIPGSSGPYGTALDGVGGLWVTDSGLPYLYHISPGLTSTDVCTYTLPLDGISYYLAAAGSQVWLGDWVNGQIYRLDTSTPTATFTRWPLAAGSEPTGMALDGSGNLWWADPYRSELGRLQLNGDNDDLVTTYTQTDVQNPTMIALEGSRVWFTDQSSFGVLNPAQNQGVTTPVAPANPAEVTPTCDSLTADTTQTFAPVPGQAAWTDTAYQTLVSSGGWFIFQLPTNGYSYGIAALDDIYLVDQGRQVLARVSKQTEIKLFLPMLSK